MSTPARYRHIKLTPPKGVQEAAKSFLAAVERGEGGDGLEDVTIREARAVARGEAITWAKADKLMRFWTRNQRFLDADKGTPAWTSALGWFGRAGFEWANKLRRQKQAADRADNNDASTPAPPSERIRGSKRNEPGSAATTRGAIEIDDETEEALRAKVDEHNEKHGDKKGKRVDIGMLKAVWRKGAGAYSTQHRRRDRSGRRISRPQWSMARVNTFLRLVVSGKPDNPSYVQDNDLLPKDHPRRSKDNAMQHVIGSSIELAESDLLEDVQIFAWGPVHHPAGDFEVDRAFAEKMLSSFRAMTAAGYKPPILQEHKSEGRAWGLVVALRVKDDGIYADFELADGVRDQVQAGERLYISPSFFPTFEHPHSGDELEFVLREVSLVAVPHLKNLRPLGSHYSLSEYGWALTDQQEAAMADLETTGAPDAATINNMDREDEDKKMADVLEAMEKRISALESYMEEKRESNEGEDKEEVPSGEKPKDNTEKRIAALERTIALKDAELKVRSQLPALDAEDVTALAEAMVSAPKSASRLLSLAEGTAKTTAPSVQAPIGVTGTAPTAPVDFTEAYDKISTELGTKDPARIINVLEERYPNLTGDTLYQ